VTLPLPHNLGIGLAVDPIRRLTLSGDVRISFWHDVQELTLTLTNPQAPAGTPPIVENLNLLSRNAWAVRAGGELRLLDGHIHLRAGAGYDSTPVPAITLGPLIPDAQRVVVGVGFGLHGNWWAADVGYLMVILIDRTSANPDFRADYHTFAHLINGSITIRLPNVLQKGRTPEPSDKVVP
jgi:long-subunit fatty acid transport protein